MVQLLIIALSLVGAAALTGAVRRFAIQKSVLDIPNERSSHSVPTPRGGGVAIVVAFIVAVLLLFGLGEIDLAVTTALVLGGAGVAILGFYDDLGHIPARWRLLGHFLAGAWIVFSLGGLAPITLWGAAIDLGFIGSALAVVFVVWMLNLYNFMDGIDGLASSEAVFVGLAGGLIYFLSGHTGLGGLSFALAASAAGFLLWNFPPAKIFMGDAGSGFLGVAMGALTLIASWVSPEFFWSWIILLGFFVVDATVTLLRRLMRGEKVYEAHRSHAYQFASRQFASHKKVTLAAWGLNLFWLFPVALLVAFGGLNGLLGVCLAYLPLVVLALKFHAGELER
ncbi:MULTISPECIES: MraY family glycosyltransferase [Pseudomonas]|uniref:Glycosyl transferase n=1 Tax=Pseudomonas plecoglossicida TaxID=70775 RepID=A0ABX4TY40_PSEDL|nr:MULTISPECIES: glycosyltransferase family 4 protein [Pseudomonas]PLU84364.1 glycosyl transferase [Pseudomonas plecoglossicida]PLU89630.1 glycosyl transferase [Pseudomonas plecoglossicida]PLU97685.1 glycosyl transferase [Pseudomonas plecoglossicida]PLV07731.1 glycosyl transferase [Pseudomonas plecoglossicida]